MLVAAAAVARPRKQKPPQWQEELFFQRLRVPRQVDLRRARGHVRARLRAARRRLRLDRDRRRAPERLQLRLERRLVDLEPPEQGRQAPEQRRRPGATSRRPTSRSSGRRTRSTRSSATRALQPEGPERARRARVAVHDARDDLRERLRDGPAARRSRQPPATAFTPPASTPLGQALQRSEGASQDPISAAVASIAQRQGIRRRTRSYQSTQTKAEARTRSSRAVPEGRDAPDPARPGGADRRRHGDCARRLPAVPEARAERPARTAGQAACSRALRRRRLPAPRIGRPVRLSAARARATARRRGLGT